MKVIIAGSRSFTGDKCYEFLKRKCDHLLSNSSDITIISGTASGADSLGELYATEKGYKIIRMPADWNQYGKRAGYLRNVQMAEIADACIIFWDGVSPGSKHMYDICIKRNLPVRLIRF